MPNNISRARLAGLWVAAVIVAAVCSALWGVAFSFNNGALWLVTCLMPPAVMLLVWRGPPPITVRDQLYSIDNPSKDAQP